MLANFGGVQNAFERVRVLIFSHQLEVDEPFGFGDGLGAPEPGAGRFEERRRKFVFCRRRPFFPPDGPTVALSSVVVRNLLECRRCGWTEESGNELEIGGGNRILILAQRGKHNVIEFHTAGSDEAIDLDGESFGSTGPRTTGEFAYLHFVDSRYSPVY